MTWIKFAVWLAAVYAAYYIAIILWDLIRSGGPALKPDEHVLSFAEHTEVIKPSFEPVPEVHGSAMVSSGGVNLKQLFNLCRDEVVDYRKAVSY